jgi:hypothetical protein
MALGRGMQAVDGLHGDVHRGVEAESEVRGPQVVVDGLRHADDLAACLVQFARDAEGVLAADRDQRVDAQALEVLQNALDPGLAVGGGGLVRGVGPRRSENRSPAGQDAPDRGNVEHHGVALKRAAPAVPETEELHLVFLRASPHDRPDHGVQAGTIAATGENSDSHAYFLSRI